MVQGSPLSDAAWITRLPKPLGGAGQGPLAGLRFAAKDNIDVAGVPTTAACPAFAYTPDRDATVVRRLLDAGAQLLGKTNLDQFACGLNGTRSPYGAVPNSFRPEYICGGSSSGSAYVVATGQADFALGTDTAGSGRVPAGFNNIVGLKPSRGLVSAAGVVPAAQSVDCVSIFAGTVGLAARVLAEASGHDALDPYSRQLALQAQPLPERFRFGVPDQLHFFGDELARDAFTQSLKLLRDLGGTPVTIAYQPLAQAAALLYDSALVAERYEAIRTFFDGRESDVIEPVRGIIAAGCGYSAAEYCEALTRLRAFEQEAHAMWDRIDVLVVPTAPTIYTIAQMQADPVTLNRRLGVYTNFVNLLDQAALAVPASMRPDGLPAGISFIGRSGSDWQLADLGQRFHHATGLGLGATNRPLPAPQAIPGLQKTDDTVQVAVVGAHLSGMPLNGQLTERGARLLRTTQTTPDYRLHALPGTQPPKPGLVRVAAGQGHAIALEVWEMPLAQYGGFVRLVPAPLAIGTLTLSDGSRVQGFLCEAAAAAGAEDISHHGGWRSYIASRCVEEHA
jgi:allophanate hydrolase